MVRSLVLGIVCYEISVMVRQMTRRIFWSGDVRHGTSEPPGPAEPADTGTAGVAARLGQPQQQRLIADPLPHVQPRTFPRRSPSSCAWQIEIAAGKLVMAARKLMCKELGAGARCWRCKAAANQITALQYIYETVGVTSLERAATELRADLDTPAHAEALKTTERKLQISEQRVATLEASLTKQQQEGLLPTTPTRKSSCSTVVPSARQR